MFFLFSIFITILFLLATFPSPINGLTSPSLNTQTQNKRVHLSFSVARNGSQFWLNIKIFNIESPEAHQIKWNHGKLGSHWKRLIYISKKRNIKQHKINFLHTLKYKFTSYSVLHNSIHMQLQGVAYNQLPFSSVVILSWCSAICRLSCKVTYPK